jgi:ANTAR domain
MQSSPTGGRVRIACRRRAEADSLQQALRPVLSRLSTLGEPWYVELHPDESDAQSFAALLGTLTDWLDRTRLASLTIEVDNRTCALVRTAGDELLEPGSLMVRISELETALESRTTIEQAKGVLVGRFGVDPQTAFDALRRTARDAGTPLRDVAQRVVSGSAESDELAIRYGGAQGQKR